jgi:hypothetical protein
MKYGEKGPYHSSVESLASDHLGKNGRSRKLDKRDFERPRPFLGMNEKRKHSHKI